MISATLSSREKSRQLAAGEHSRQRVPIFQHCQRFAKQATYEEMPSVAEQMRQAREKQSLSIHDVAELTKIKTDHIRALEEGNYHAFPAPVYIRGFVRTYGTTLRLNVPRLLEDLDAELLEHEQFQEAPSLLGKRRSFLDLAMLQVASLPWKLLLLLLVLVGVVVGSVWGYRLWINRKPDDPLERLGPGFYQPLPTNYSGEYLPVPPVSNRSRSER